MEQEVYQSLVLKLDSLITDVRVNINEDDFPYEKSELYRCLRQCSHWLSDIRNIQDFRQNPPKLKLEGIQENGNSPA